MSGEFLRAVFHRQTGVYKWDHYFDIYERFFSPIREKSFTLVEIGVYKGGSLRMWRDYFPNAKIVGIDITEECKQHEGERISVEIGSQADAAFLSEVCARHGSPRVVIDDGSHRCEDQAASFHALFPQLANGGLYLVEDLHSPDLSAFVDLAKAEIANLHSVGPVGLIGVHFFRSVVLFDRGERISYMEVSR